MAISRELCQCWLQQHQWEYKRHPLTTRGLCPSCESDPGDPEISWLELPVSSFSSEVLHLESAEPSELLLKVGLRNVRHLLIELEWTFWFLLSSQWNELKEDLSLPNDTECIMSSMAVVESTSLGPKGSQLWWPPFLSSRIALVAKVKSATDSEASPGNTICLDNSSKLADQFFSFPPPPDDEVDEIFFELVVDACCCCLEFFSRWLALDPSFLVTLLLLPLLENEKKELSLLLLLVTLSRSLLLEPFFGVKFGDPWSKEWNFVSGNFCPFSFGLWSAGWLTSVTYWAGTKKGLLLTPGLITFHLQM